MAFDINNALVFGLHDVGEGEPGWSNELFRTLDEAVATFNYSDIQRELEAQQKSSISELIDFHELSYGGVFQNLLTNWAQNAAKVLETVQGLPQQPQIERCMGLLESHCDPSDHVVWPHVAGVFFWKTSSYVRAMIKNEVAAVLSAQVAARRQKDKGKRVQTSLLAHGLGTVIATETLNDMYGGAWSGARWSTQDMQFDSYHTIANVCRLLSADEPGAHAYVRPAAAGESAVLCFYDYRHRADPFTCLRPFAPVGWPHDLYEAIVVKHVRSTNVHALEHYLQHPAVHIPILRSWFGYYCVSEQQEYAARATFSDVSLDRERIANVVEQVARLAQRELALSPDVAELIQGVAAFRLLLRRSDA